MQSTCGEAPNMASCETCLHAQRGLLATHACTSPLTGRSEFLVASRHCSQVQALSPESKLVRTGFAWKDLLPVQALLQQHANQLASSALHAEHWRNNPVCAISACVRGLEQHQHDKPIHAPLFSSTLTGLSTRCHYVCDIHGCCSLTCVAGT